MRYALEEYVFNDYNASSKARKDVSYFVLQNGFKTLGKNDKTKIKNSKFSKALMAFRLYLKLFFTLGKEDVVFLQTSYVVLKPILLMKKIKRFKVAYLIHDLFSLGFTEEDSIKEHELEIKNDIRVLSQCDYVIAHNPSMVEKLKAFGCKSQLISLGIFDYYTDLPANRREHKANSEWRVAFAGALSKSPFLMDIDRTQHKYKMIIYGLPKKEFISSDYKGSVDADILPSVIEGDFGLIWEGSYQITKENNYTRFNNPHKTSMYIVAGLPIICWKESAAAKFVEKYNLGFSIETLDEIDAKLETISASDYQTMVDNCLKMRESLIQGIHVQHALNEIKI